MLHLRRAKIDAGVTFTRGWFQVNRGNYVFTGRVSFLLPNQQHESIYRNSIRTNIYKYSGLFIKKLQAIYLMLYKRYKTAKIKKYKHEHVLAYTFNLSSVARINV